MIEQGGRHPAPPAGPGLRVPTVSGAAAQVTHTHPCVDAQEADGNAEKADLQELIELVCTSAMEHSAPSPMVFSATSTQLGMHRNTRYANNPELRSSTIPRGAKRPMANTRIELEPPRNQAGAPISPAPRPISPDCSSPQSAARPRSSRACSPQATSPAQVSQVTVTQLGVGGAWPTRYWDAWGSHFGPAFACRPPTRSSKIRRLGC